jgi:hypothetical protein
LVGHLVRRHHLIVTSYNIHIRHTCHRDDEGRLAATVFRDVGEGPDPP